MPAPILTYEAETYATVADVRAAGVPDGTTDEQILDALTYATELVNRRADTKFGIITSQTIHDVRTDTVVLNTAGTIDTVSVYDTVLPAESYQVLDFGLRFTAPSGGAWYHPTRPLTVEPIRSWWAGGRGVTVTVTGTFGEAVSPLIKRATILLAVEDLGGSESDVIGELPEGVQSFSVEGLSVSFAAGTTDDKGRVSTGNEKANRLIDLVTSRGPFVA